MPLSRQSPVRGQPHSRMIVLVVIALIAIARMFFQPEEFAPPPGGAPPVEDARHDADHPGDTVPDANSNPENGRPPADEQWVSIRRVVDGDTLLLEDGQRVRLLGVDTPETKLEGVPPEPFGPEASDFTTKLLSGKRVRLVFDRERYDQYDRILAFVYVGDLLVNEELIRRGLSPAQLQYPYRSDMKTKFRNAEKAAKAEGLGIWSLEEPSELRSQRRRAPNPR